MHILKLTGSCALISALGISCALAFNLSERMQSKPTFHMSIDIACGKLAKANCAQVLPHIAEQSGRAGLSFNAGESDGSTMSARAVCDGSVQAAIGQRDAFTFVGQTTECSNKFDQTGAALYPYYGYFITRADSPYSSVSDMVAATPEGKFLRVAAGTSGSGGVTTLGAILRHNPSMKRVISLEDYDDKTGPQRLKEGTLDAYFVMDAPYSDFIDKVKSDQDAKGNPTFKILDLQPGDEFYSIADWHSKKLYQPVLLVDGGFFGHSTYTVSVDAIVITNNRWREDESKNGPTASSILAKAIDDAQASIYGDTKTPKDWKPAVQQQN